MEDLEEMEDMVSARSSFVCWFFDKDAEFSSLFSFFLLFQVAAVVEAVTVVQEAQDTEDTIRITREGTVSARRMRLFL